MSSFDSLNERSPGGRWKHGALPVLGLTGTIGSGKSRFAAMLAQRGLAVIDADAVGHEVLENPEIGRQVVQRFGAGILREEGAAEPPRIDRRALGRIVFTDPAARRELEAIVHPEMRRRFERSIGRLIRDRAGSAVVLDAAILFEAGWDALCDLVVFVDAAFPVRLKRVSQDRGWTTEMLRDRETAQWSADAKRERADLHVNNDAGLEKLEQEADAVVRRVARYQVAADLLREESRPGVVDRREPVPAASADSH